MASWGDIAVGVDRPSYAYPSKSAILGLITAALGISRDEESLHCQMAKGYGFAVRVDNMGTPLSDYHTIQVPTRTILSRRDYRLDALATVVLWEITSAPYSLGKLAEALQSPVYTLYLGRKSCPLALPAQAQVVAADTILNALTKAKFADLEELCCLPYTGRAALYWEEGANSGIEPHRFERRWDAPISRRRWQFEARREYHALCPEEK